MTPISKIWILVALACCLAAATAEAANYVVLISAGRATEDDAYTNCEYWYDLLLAYEMLIDNGYDHDDVYVLYGEGIPFGSNHARYQNPYPENFVDYNNHKTTIQSVFASLNDVVTGSDQLFVWWLGHGGQAGGNLQMYIENTGQYVLDTEFAGYVAQIEHCGLRVYSFMTCFSGGIIDDLEGPDAIVTTSSDFYVTSQSDYLCDAPHTEFHYHETCANHWQTPFGQCGPVDADENTDEKISFREAFDHAAAGTSSPAQISDPSTLAPGNFLANLGLRCTALAIDDDDSGASHGNGNQLVEYNETIELGITLENLSDQDLYGVQGTLTCDDEYVTLLVGEADFGDIPADGGTGTNETPVVFATNATIPDGYTIELELALAIDPPEIIRLAIPAYAPELQVVAYEIDDSAGGDGDGLPESGETVVLTATISNAGSVGLADASLAFGGDPYLEPDPVTLQLGAMEPDAIAQAPPLTLVVDGAAPEIYAGTLTAIMRGSRDYRRTRIVLFNVGDVFHDDMEIGDSWIHYPASTGFGDEWHVEGYRNHTYNGAQSWKCGGAGGANYADGLHAALESSPFTLLPDCRLTVWHWMDAETSNYYEGYCYDGGLVEISIDGGSWEVITPTGGYPYLTRGTSGPFPADTPVLSGSHGWEQLVFDLSAYEGSARIRFVFGSDGAVRLEGWYVDDVNLEVDTFSDRGPDVRTQTVRLRPARPNPARDRSQLLLELPIAGRVTARVYDASGRRVRDLLSEYLPAGSHVLTWNGTDDAGRVLEAGVYWIRASVVDHDEMVRLVRVR